MLTILLSDDPLLIFDPYCYHIANCQHHHDRYHHQYVLQTFTEQREIIWQMEPMEGRLMIEPDTSPPPQPWDIHVPPLEQFKDHQRSIVVPRTTTIRVCDECIGNGRVRCRGCNGFGGEICINCNGAGRRDSLGDDSIGNRENRCNKCAGSGRLRCTSCRGSGQVRCPTCQGCGKLKYYLQMLVKWRTHKDEAINSRVPIPEDLLTKVTGTVVLDERGSRVYPLTNFPEPILNQKSQEMIQRQQNCGMYEKILEQRHFLRIIPIGTAAARRGDKPDHHQLYHFHVYGLERKVYFPDYPGRLCRCCTIL